MAITFVNAGTFAAANNADVTPALPTGHAVNDLLMVLVQARGENAQAGAMTINSVGSGYTQLFNFTHTTGSPMPRMGLWYKIEGASEGNPLVDIAPLATGASVIAQVAAFRGIDTADPIDVSSATSENASAANIGPITGITPLASNGAVIVCGGRADNWTSVALLTGESLTWVEIGEPSTALGQDAGIVWDHAIWVGSAPASIANKTFVVTGGAANKGLGFMFSINPAPPSTTKVANWIQDDLN